MPVSRIFALLLITGTWAAISQACTSSPTSPTPGNRSPQGPLPGTRTAVLVGAGDIGLCGQPWTAATGRIIETIPGEVFLAGDIAYPHGELANFIECFEPFWGHARDRWRPTPGNHEYERPGASPYFDYFGRAAGPDRLGYYRFTAGEWLVFMLNSNIPASRGSPQYEFVRGNLLSTPARCTAAIWHHPLFSSGPNGSSAFMRDMVQLLYDHGAEVVINGHEHFYERFTRQDPMGRQDFDRGIRQFIVGTGGADLYGFATVAPNSTVRIATHGVLRLELRPDSYEWQFLQVNGGIPDTGFSVCH